MFTESTNGSNNTEKYIYIYIFKNFIINYIIMNEILINKILLSYMQLKFYK